MTVLQVIPELDTGGAERTTVEIAAALKEAGGKAVVVSEGGRLVKDLEAAGGKHVEMPVKSKRIWTMRRNARRIAELVAKENIDIIHARSRAPAWSCLWAADWTGKPLVTTYHGAYSEGSWLKNRYNSVMARGDIVIANSSYIAELIAKRHPFAAKQIVTIHRGVDFSQFANTDGLTERAEALQTEWEVSPRDPIILNLARLTPWKGQRVLIEALEHLAKINPARWVTVMAGDDQGRADYAEELKTKIDEAGLTDRVKLVGHVSDVPAAFAAASIAVQPNTEPEAFGRAAVEAQAAGVPVVVSDLGAVSETVLAPPTVPPQKRTGWTVPPGDPKALAEALSEALQSSGEMRRRTGARGRAHANARFSLAAMQQKTLGVYRSILEDDISALY